MGLAPFLYSHIVGQNRIQIASTGRSAYLVADVEVLQPLEAVDTQLEISVVCHFSRFSHILSIWERPTEENAHGRQQ